MRWRHRSTPTPYSPRTVAGLTVDYRPRSDRRQKRIRLRLVPGRMLVSFPAGWTQRTIDQFIDQHHDWIAARAQPAPSYHTGQTLAGGWQLEIRPGQRRQMKSGRLIVSDQPARIEAGLKALLQRLAVTEIEPQARALADQTGLDQPDYWRFVYLTSCWGNCRWQSGSGGSSISLNTALVNLPAELVELVIIHELCHLKLRQSGHNPAFWQLFESHLPQARRLSRQLNRTWRPSLLPSSPPSPAKLGLATPVAAASGVGL